MFKPGRGGGGRRPGMAAPPPRPAGSLGRAPISSASRGRGRGGPATSASVPPTREETFSLESGGPPDFASIIRLIPDLVDEIRRCEAQGGTARIKFGSNVNSSENVIEVGLKEYNFTWSAEFGVCDIYEVYRNGEGGNGLLIERGSAVRKMNVQRILDESAKNQVKMRSVQAELQSKSRKSIILDPANPSVQKQVKSMAAAGVEGSMRRWGSKDKFLKKPNQVPISAPPKTITKVVAPSSGLPKNGPSVSPVLSPPQHSFRGSGMDLTVETIKEEITPQNLHRDESKKIETGSAARSGNGLKARNSSDNSADLRSFLINILSENPKGLSFKALEKSVGNSFSNSAKKMETIVKTIATYQAPGRYILKHGVAPESSKWHASDRSSPDSTPEFHDEIEEALREEEYNTLNNDIKMQNVAPPSAFGNLEEEPLDIEKIDIEGGSPLMNNLNIDIDINNNESEGKASSSSDSSDSDTDSDSSGNSGSDRSPHSAAGSGSQSSSQSDTSSSSDEDVMVNITSDDEKEPNLTSRIVGADLNLHPFSEQVLGQNGFTREDTGLVNITSSPLINLNDDMPVTPVTASGAGVGRRALEEENLDQLLGGLGRKVDRPAMKNDFTERKMSLGERRPGPSLNGKQNSNLKRTSTDRLPDAKRPKKAGPSSNLPVEVIPIGQNKGGLFPESSPNLRPDRSADWDININLESGYVSTSKEQSGAKNTARRPGNNRSLSNERLSDGKLVQKRMRNRTNSDANDSVPPAKRPRENSTVPQRTATNGQKSPAGLKKVLRREVSELELGEFREPEDELKRLFGSSSSSKPEDDDEDDDINIENKSNNANNSANSNKIVANDNTNMSSRHALSASSPHLAMRPQQRAAIYSCSNNYQEVSDRDRDKSTRAHKSDEEDGNHNKNRSGGAHSSKKAVVPQVRSPAPQLESNNKQDGNNNGVRPAKKPNKVYANGELTRIKGPSSCDDSLYLKYNKDQPDLKGPIHNIAQFEEYIKEFQEKYPIYLSLNKQFEEYRERYTRMGKEMEAAKGKNRVQHASITEKMREMFRLDKDRHCLLKKVFLVLHEELATIKEKLSDFYDEYNQNID